MSILGQVTDVRYWPKQTLISTLSMSAFGGKADIPNRLADVR